MNPEELVINNGRVSWTKHIGDYTLEFDASEIRRTPTGLHARWGVLLNGAYLGWTVGNVERDEDRNRLARRCHQRLPEVAKAVYLEKVLKYDVDDFCANIWQTLIRSYEPTPLEGDPTLETDFLLYPFIIRGGGTIMFAPPGEGKSYLGMLQAVSIDAGCDHLWHTEQAPTLFINLERSARSIQKRLGHINIALGLDQDRPLRTLNARGRTMRDVMEMVETYVKREGIEFMFLDSISRGGAGSLSADEVANSIIDILNNSCETWLALAHTPKHDDSAFGSQMFYAGADIMVHLTSETTQGMMGVSLKIEKANDIAKPEPQIMALEFDEWGGLSVVRNATPKEFVDLEMGAAKTRRQKIWMALQNGPLRPVQIAEETGISATSVSAALAKYRDKDFAMGVDGRWARVSHESH